jgi:hypothetical protein
MNCSDFLDLIQRRLDGDIHDSALGLEAHLASCAPCRRLEAATRRLERALDLMVPAKPFSGLGGRIVARVMADRCARMRFRRQLLAGAAAAGILLTALLAYQRSGRPTPGAPPQIAHVEPAAPQRSPVSLQASVREAGTALVALVERTADEAVEQGRVLFPTSLPSQTAFDTGTLPLEPPVRSLREAGQGLSAGLEPVATSARRAVDLFLREVPTEGKLESKK